MRASTKFLAISTAAILSLPFLVSAQSSGLSEAIRAEILKDPRSSNIPSAQVDAMVASLAQAAAQQGVTESDITWRPVESIEGGTASPCGFLCSVNAIFGFGGDDYTIPIGLGITSALLVLFLSAMLHRHHKHDIVPPTIESIHTHS